MKRNRLISEPLEKEHRDIDVVIVSFIEGSGDVTSLMESLALLRRHIYMEELILFPRLSSHNLALTMHVSMMEIEHGYMWPMIRKLEDAANSGMSADDMKNTCTALLELLQLHNTREEEILYAAADRMSPGGGGEPGLLSQVTDVHMPPDWTCGLAPA